MSIFHAFSQAKKRQPPPASRRSFLAYSGATLTASGLLLLGCSEDELAPPPVDDSLAAPSDLTVNNKTAGQLTLSWTDNANDADGFVVERSLSMDSGFASVGTGAAGVTTYTDLTPEAATPYYYRVAATRGTEVSTYSNVVNGTTAAVVAVFGPGDVGILNYAYALEQLEAAFYATVLTGGYYTAAAENEKQVLTDLHQHEVNHREFFRAAIPAEARIPDLSVDFSAIDFDNRNSVLGAAKVLEDLGVSAYNGAGQFIERADYLLLAGKIVSVEARHASAIRDLLNPNSADFAGDDIIGPTGLEITRSFADVLTAAGAFITTEIDASGLPPETGFQIS